MQCKFYLLCLLLPVSLQLMGSDSIVNHDYVRPPVVYPVPEGKLDRRHSYPVSLFHMIMENSDSGLKTAPMEIQAEQDRILLLLERGILDVFWTGASKYRDDDYRSIPIPMFKGLLGYRLVLVHKGDEHLLAGVRTLSGLRSYSVGQGGGWPEVSMYSEAGFIVHTATTYNGLFNMLEKRRFHLFPRSVVEVWDEIETFGTRNIALDQHVVLRYPHSMFIFVRKGDVALGDAIERGFLRTIENGEFDELFNEYHGAVISRAKLNERVTINVPNNNFPDIPKAYRGFYYIPQ